MLTELRDLIFTPRCIGCARLGHHLCTGCLASLHAISTDQVEGVLRVTAAGSYGGWLRDALIHYKNGVRSQVNGLAHVLSHVLTAEAQLGPAILVPIPSTAEKVALRGYDSMNLLVRESMKVQPQPFQSHAVLSVHRRVRDQVGLTAAERQCNVENSMRALCPVEGTVIVVDDVITTGSTIREAARALHLAGARKVFGISLCGSAKWG